MYTSGQFYDTYGISEYNVSDFAHIDSLIGPKSYAPHEMNLNIPPTYENYVATDGITIFKTVFAGTFIDDKKQFETPKLNISGFGGCPHFYGKIYWKGKIYEIQHKMTQKFLEEGHKTGGDWTGYKIGDWTQRFIDKQTLEKAFDLFKSVMQ